MMPSSSGLEISAYAKVNLALAVTGRRGDGYHELRSVFLRLELADTLLLAGTARSTDGDGPASPPDILVVEGDPACPVTDNLVLRAIEAFRAAAARAGTVVPRVRVTLAKRIPMAAGLGGGSADAAAMLRLLAARHPGAIPSTDLETLAIGIGADVPFCLDGAGAALVSGIGEVVEPLPPPIDPVGVLLLSPAVGSSTAAVFSAWDDLTDPADTADPVAPPTAARPAIDSLARLLRSGADGPTLAAHAPTLRDANDLWHAASAVTPGQVALRDSLERRLGRPVLLTGSGSSLFSLYPSPDAAAGIAAAVRSEPMFATLRVNATRSTGPHPAHITSRRDQ
jgi:4-diphosphocytidyl-2-C-methyl-D-erythritol kinase